MNRLSRSRPGRVVRSKNSLTCVLESRKEGERGTKDIFKNHDQKISKLDENCKPTDSRSTTNPKENIYKENYIKIRRKLLTTSDRAKSQAEKKDT